MAETIPLTSFSFGFCNSIAKFLVPCKLEVFHEENNCYIGYLIQISETVCIEHVPVCLHGSKHPPINHHNLPFGIKIIAVDLQLVIVEL